MMSEEQIGLLSLNVFYLYASCPCHITFSRPIFLDLPYEQISQNLLFMGPHISSLIFNSDIYHFYFFQLNCVCADSIFFFMCWQYLTQYCQEDFSSCHVQALCTRGKWKRRTEPTFVMQPKHILEYLGGISCCHFCSIFFFGEETVKSQPHTAQNLPVQYCHSILGATPFSTGK